MRDVASEYVMVKKMEKINTEIRPVAQGTGLKLRLCV